MYAQHELNCTCLSQTTLQTHGALPALHLNTTSQLICMLRARWLAAVYTKTASLDSGDLMWFDWLFRAVSHYHYQIKRLRYFLIGLDISSSGREAVSAALILFSLPFKNRIIFEWKGKQSTIPLQLFNLYFFFQIIF